MRVCVCVCVCTYVQKGRIQSKMEMQLAHVAARAGNSKIHTAGQLSADMKSTDTSAGVQRQVRVELFPWGAIVLPHRRDEAHS